MPRSVRSAYMRGPAKRLLADGRCSIGESVLTDCLGVHQIGSTHSTKPGAVHNSHDYLHVAVDDHTRLRLCRGLERDLTAAGFLIRATDFFEGHGISVERVLSNQGNAYRARVFAGTAAKLGIQRRCTRAYRPQTNSKAA